MTVTGCHDCPLAYDASYCLHPSNTSVDVWNGVDGKAVPDACPLRDAPLLITLGAEPEPRET